MALLPDSECRLPGLLRLSETNTQGRAGQHQASLHSDGRFMTVGYSIHPRASTLCTVSNEVKKYGRIRLSLRENSGKSG